MEDSQILPFPRVRAGDQCAAYFEKDEEGEWPSDWYPGTVDKIQNGEALIAWEGRWAGKRDWVPLHLVHRNWYKSTELKDNLGHVFDVLSVWDGPISALGSRTRPLLDLLPLRGMEATQTKNLVSITSEDAKAEWKDVIAAILYGRTSFVVSRWRSDLLVMRPSGYEPRAMDFIHTYRERAGAEAAATLSEALDFNTKALNELRESMEERLDMVLGSQEIINRRFGEAWRQRNGYESEPSGI
jgi:hypothetical protein